MAVLRFDLGSPMLRANALSSTPVTEVSSDDSYLSVIPEERTKEEEELNNTVRPTKENSSNQWSDIFGSDVRSDQARIHSVQTRKQEIGS